ncbi:MAG: tetratricopeptide repeat protein, partial [Candidatus Cloacimonadota bacterium]
VNSRMLITGAFREEDVADEKSRLMQVVQDLLRERLIDEIKIGSLSPKELKEFVSVALGLWEVPPDVVDFIQETTEGNPLFIVEILHILIEKGYIYKSGISWNFLKLDEVDLPKKIAGVLADKIKTVHSDTKELLMTASVIGELFSLQQLMCITGEHEEKLLDLLNEGAKKGIIVSDSEMKGEYQFSYRILQRVLYDSLPLERKKNIHEKVADMLALLTEGRDENLEKLAFHYKRATTYEKALSYYLSGARKAVETVAYQKAIELYLEALELAQILKISDRSLFDIYYELGCLYTNTGKLNKAQKIFLDSLKLSGVGSGMRMKVFHEIGKIYTKRGGFDTAIEYFQKAKKLLPEIDTDRRATLLSDEAVVYLKRGEYARAFGLARSALQGFGEGDIAEKADVFNTIGNTYFFGGNLEEALKNYNRSLHFARKCFDQRRIAIAHKSIGQIFLEQGRKWDAEKFFKLSLEFAQKVGDLFLTGKVHNNLGVLFMPHDTEKARGHFMSSLRIKRRIGDEDGVAVIFNNIGNLYVREGELAKGLSMFQEALRIWLLMEVQPSLAVTYLNIGGVYYLHKDFEKSFYNTFKGKEIAQSIKFVSGEIAGITNLAQILLEEGKGKGVLELLMEAEKLNTIYKSDDCIINIALLRSQVAFENGDITESKQQYEYIVENVSKIVDRNLEKRVEIFGGRLLIHQEEFEEAMRYFERAMMICELTGDVFCMVTVLYYKAVLNVRKKETGDAKQLLLLAKEMLTRHDAKLLSSKVNSLLREIECTQK